MRKVTFSFGKNWYKYVKECYNEARYKEWEPFLINKGIIAFHDTTQLPGPRKVVEDNLFKSKKFKNVNYVDSITYATKTKSNTFLQRIKNRIILFKKKIFHIMIFFSKKIKKSRR
jgi:hypothetical protein